MRSASWAAAPVSAAPADANRINNQTVRNVIHLSVGGDKVRVKFSNRYGTSALVLNGASVAIRCRRRVHRSRNEPDAYIRRPPCGVVHDSHRRASS